MEIRQYPPRLAASVTLPGSEIESRAAGFRILARYIFGANRSDAEISMTAPVAQAAAKIAMTAPVAQSQSGAGWTITFTMPARYTMATLPRPTDPRIKIEELAVLTAAVYRFSGIPNLDAVAQARAALLGRLTNSDWRVAGDVMTWFYDPPWTLPWLRRNEVAVPVRPASG